MTKPKVAAPAKSATDALIERLAEKELKESTNALAIADVEETERDPKAKEPQVVRKVTFANGAVLESLA